MNWQNREEKEIRDLDLEEEAVASRGKWSVLREDSRAATLCTVLSNEEYGGF
jgi:hypothetical protein